jgi:F0F1-type ATP synthase assembly protein I
VEAARASFQLAFRVLAQVGLLALGVIAVAIIGGVLLDRLLDTRPLFTVLLLLVSFPVSLYIIYLIALKAISQIRPAGRKPPGKEGTDSDKRA